MDAGTPSLPLDRVPAPDPDAAPEGFVVTVDRGDRVHFLDWGAVAATIDPVMRATGIILIHGIGQTGAIWAPIARRLHALRQVVAVDLRGHGLSDAPTEPGSYELEALAGDIVAVAEGSGALADAGPDRIVLAGHGFGAIVATAAAAELGARCAGLVLVDGGWAPIEASTGLEVDEFLRGLDEPPEVLASMATFLADRRAFDPASWDADQEAAARATVVPTHAGHVVPVTRPHVLEACVRTMFAYDPVPWLARVTAPVIAIAAAESGDDQPGARARALATASAARATAGLTPIRTVSFPHDGHNLMRYRPVEVAAAILAVDGGAE